MVSSQNPSDDKAATRGTQESSSSATFNEYAEIAPDKVAVWVSYLSAPSGAQFPLTGAEVSIGRPYKRGRWVPTIDLSAERYGDTVSRRHAVLTRRGVLWHVHEVSEGTENGTHLNGRKLTAGESLLLRDGDVLRVGWVELTFCQGK